MITTYAIIQSINDNHYYLVTKGGRYEILKTKRMYI